MVIKEQTPVTLAEVVELAGDSDSGKEIKSFIKKFNKMSADKAREIKADLEGLDLIKLKETDIVKIVDFMPKDSSDLNKIVENSLDQEEIDKILDVVNKHK